MTSVNPASGATAGGNTVTITGANFTGATAVTFGGVAASSFTVVNDTTITAVPSGGSAGSVSIVVTAPTASNAANMLYSYVEPTPTLGEWGMLALAALLVCYAWFRLRRQDGLEGA